MTPAEDTVRPLRNDGVRRLRLSHGQWRILQAALAYYMTIVTMGWLLGPVRDYFERAGGDALLGALSETVATLLVLIWAAGWVVDTFGVPPSLRARLAVGGWAVAFTLAGDFTSGFLLYGLTPAQVASEFARPEGMVIAVSLALAALLPLVRSRRQD